MVAFDGRSPVLGRTVDVSANSVSISLADPVAEGQGGEVRFDLLVDGKVTPVNTRVKVNYCIFSQGEFKVGFQFAGLDPAVSSALTRFLC